MKMRNFIKEMEIILNSGDREVRTWFLIRNNYLPFILCGSYALFSTIIGPAFMKNRKPYDLRKVMILFNFFLVASYIISLAIAFYYLPHVSREEFCKGTHVRKGDVRYYIASAGYVIYILKYVEFLDTEKTKSDYFPPRWASYSCTTSGLDYCPVGNQWLRVPFVQKFIMGLVGALNTGQVGLVSGVCWKLEKQQTPRKVVEMQDFGHTRLAQTETLDFLFVATVTLMMIEGGMQTLPCLINSIVHIIMYSYYGLAAMGPSVRKYLWWKKYLTQLQMIQFMLIIFIVVVIAPLSGCKMLISSYIMDILIAPAFLYLFYKFYKTRF